jgi:hypothetical protein
MNKKIFLSVVMACTFAVGYFIVGNVGNNHQNEVHAGNNAEFNAEYDFVKEILQQKGHTVKGMHTTVGLAENDETKKEAFISVELEYPIPVTTEEAKGLFSIFAKRFKEVHKVDNVVMHISFPEAYFKGNAMYFTTILEEKDGQLIKEYNQFENDYGVEETKNIKAERQAKEWVLK